MEFYNGMVLTSILKFVVYRSIPYIMALQNQNLPINSFKYIQQKNFFLILECIAMFKHIINQIQLINIP